MAEMARGALSLGWWDKVACVKVLKNAAGGWHGWTGATAEEAESAAARWAEHSKPKAAAARDLTARAHAPWLARSAVAAFATCVLRGWRVVAFLGRAPCVPDASAGLVCTPV